jgi:hypothetical protein
MYKDWKIGGRPMPGASTSSTVCKEEVAPGNSDTGKDCIAAEVPWFKFVAAISRPWEDTAWKGETGRVDDLVRKYADLWELRPESYNRVPLWASQQVRKRARHPSARWLAERLRLRRGRFLTGEGSDSRIARSRLALNLLQGSFRVTGVQCGPARIRIRIRFSFSISEEAS